MNNSNCKIKLANLIIEIENPNAYLLDKCKDYLVGAENTDIFIKKATAAEIDRERTIAINQRRIDNLPEIDFDQGYLEYINVYRKIANEIPRFGVILMHAAAIAVDGKAYMFLAKSGTGKTTHIMNWVKSIPGTIVINGDKPLVDTRNMTVCGTPWSGKENLNTNISFPLSAICILERGVTNQISKIEAWDAIGAINDQTYWSSNAEMRRKTLQTLDKFKEISCFRLYCTQEIKSARVAYDAMSR